MARDFWNSEAAVVRLREDGAAATVAVGRLHEMVSFLLSEDGEGDRGLRLVGEAVEGPLGREPVRRLHERRDFPIMC